jgi:hypothetical protein
MKYSANRFLDRLDAYADGVLSGALWAILAGAALVCFFATMVRS